MHPTYGRIFARSGGLSDAVAEGLKEQNIDFDAQALRAATASRPAAWRC